MVDFQKHVGFSDTCWLWLGKKDSGGYGMYDDRKAHRIVYELLVGSIPPKMTIDHLCMIRDCVNPDHLEVVTLRENILRGKRFVNPKYETHCPAGHEHNDINTYATLRKGKTVRNCRLCNKVAARKYKRKLKVLS